MKNYLIILLLFFTAKLPAQSYKILTDSALHTMWKAKDSVGERQALILYEQAFNKYPDDIDLLGLYKASVLAGNLKELDKAFKYLEPLSKIKGSNPGWKIIAGNYYKFEYANLLNDPRWAVIFKIATLEKQAFFKTLEDKEAEFKKGGLGKLQFNKGDDGKTVYQKIKAFGDYPEKSYQNYSVKFNVTDSLVTSYLISLPKGYNPKNKYPLMFFLHGAVQSNALSAYQDEENLEGWNRFYTSYAAKHKVIMVYLKGSRKYNWMFPDDGFFMVPAVLREIKQHINVDDDKVFVTGHSNGATGSFSYLIKQQSPFAAFFGFNTQPKVRTGGTFLRNIQNRSYFNISTDQDYYFPPGANDSLNVIVKKLNLDYQDHRFNGFPHWFPQFDESEPVYPLIFAEINNKKRNPFHKSVYWECDDTKYGRQDWINIDLLDTVSNPKDWAKPINFNIYQLLSYDKNEQLIKKDTVLKAFNFPRRSGAVKGYFEDNKFYLETSNVGAFTVFISPEMVDMSRVVTIFVNGKQRVSRLPVYDKNFILNNFHETYDRNALWIDKIQIKL